MLAGFDDQLHLDLYCATFPTLVNKIRELQYKPYGAIPSGSYATWLTGVAAPFLLIAIRDVRANNATVLRGSVHEITTFEEAFMTGRDENVIDSSAVGNFGLVCFFSTRKSRLKLWDKSSQIVLT